MLSTLLVVLPIFALIFAGWLVRKLGALGPHATGELNRFVVYLGLPTLLFDITAHARWVDIWQPGFITAFAVADLAVFGVTIAWRMRQARPLPDATIDGLNAGYGNTGFIGFPLATVALGREALPPTLIAALFTTCALFACAIVLIEVGLQSEPNWARLALKVGRSLAKNPLVVSPILGALVPITGLTLPASVETFLKLLGSAAPTCALVALGLFLAEPRKREGDRTTTAVLVGFKLLLHPVLTYILAALVFRLPPLLTHAAVLLAALPTGTGPFMLAEFYRREAGVTANAILISTLLSLFTVSAYLAVAK